MVYRRFGSVFSRLLLRKQDEISKMEATLHAMDKTDEQSDGQYLMSHALDECRESLPSSWSESRTQLMDKMETKALRYGRSRVPSYLSY